jgi:UDP-N-acetylglucosamine transferase subunit ALG13
MIFVTVGTQFGFDRLLETIDQAFDNGLIADRIFAQKGPGEYIPRHFDAVESLEKRQFDEYMSKADGVIGHAGMGTITMALQYKKPLLVMPRLQKYGEVVNDHQVAIARQYEKLGHLLVAYTPQEFPAALARLGGFAPKPRVTCENAVAERISSYLFQIRDRK